MKLKGPLFSLSASKQLGKALVYKTKGGKAFLTKYSKPFDINRGDSSLAQLAEQANYSTAVTNWNELSESQKEEYNESAKGQKMTGYNLFLKEVIGKTPVVIKYPIDFTDDFSSYTNNEFPIDRYVKEELGTTPNGYVLSGILIMKGTPSNGDEEIAIPRDIEIESGTIEVKVKSPSGTGAAYICPHFDYEAGGTGSGTKNKYEIYLDFPNQQINIAKMVDDLWTKIAGPINVTLTADTWYTLKVIIEQSETTNTIKGYIDNILKIEVTDNSLMLTKGVAVLSYYWGESTDEYEIQFDDLHITADDSTFRIFRRIEQNSDDCFDKGTAFDDGFYMQVGSDGGSSGHCKVGIRFKGIGLPKNAIIDSAIIYCRANSNSGLNLNLICHGDNQDDSPTFNSGDSPTDRNNTEASVNWDTEAWTTGEYYSPPNLKTVIQEIIDRPDWEQWNDLSLFINWRSPSNEWQYNAITAFNSITTGGTRIVVTYHTP